MVSAFESGEVDANYETSADYLQILDGLGLAKSESRDLDHGGAHERQEQAV